MKAIAELRKMQWLVSAIHTSDPKELIDIMEEGVNDEPSKDIVGDLEGLENLKHKRQGQGGD